METDPNQREQLKEHAEQMFVEALWEMRHGKLEQRKYDGPLPYRAGRAGRMAVQLYQQYEVRTLEDATPLQPKREFRGEKFWLPELIHEEVVRERLLQEHRERHSSWLERDVKLIQDMLRPNYQEPGHVPAWDG